MAFQIKDFVSITASMINWMKSTTQKVTDFNIGSVVRTMLEAIAAEIDELYQQMLIGLREAIPVSVYNSFDFAAEQAKAASGLIRVTITAGPAFLISSGTTFSVAGRSVTYILANDVQVSDGDTLVDVPVSASSAGIGGNLADGASFTLSPAPDRFVSATNPSPFMNGQDDETEDGRKLRFNAFIASLNRGTLAALDYGMRLANIVDDAGNVIERVASTRIIEPWVTDSLQPISLVNCYVHNGVGGTSSALVARTREVLYGYYDDAGTAVPGWKAAGVRVDVFAATESVLNVSAVLTAAAGYDKPTLVTSVENLVFAYIQSLPIGVTAIRAEIIAIAMSVDGVSNFVMSSPSADVAVAANVKIMPGTFAIT